MVRVVHGLVCEVHGSASAGAHSCCSLPAGSWRCSGGSPPSRWSMSTAGRSWRSAHRRGTAGRGQGEAQLALWGRPWCKQTCMQPPPTAGVSRACALSGPRQPHLGAVAARVAWCTLGAGAHLAIRRVGLAASNAAVYQCWAGQLVQEGGLAGIHVDLLRSSGMASHDGGLNPQADACWQVEAQGDTLHGQHAAKSRQDAALGPQPHLAERLARGLAPRLAAAPGFGVQIGGLIPRAALCADCAVVAVCCPG